MVYTGFDQLIKAAKNLKTPKRMVIAAAAQEHTIEAAIRAMSEGVAQPIFVGDKNKICKILDNLNASIQESDIYDVAEPSEASKMAVKLIRDKKADFLMKGLVDTGILLKAVVDKENGLGQGKLMTHFSAFEIPNYHKLLVPVDGGMVTYPSIAQKKEIIENTVAVMKNMGYDCPKVGVLACVEKVNPKMPETVEANLLKEMNQNGEIKDCIVEGPISYDCAVSREAAEAKGYVSPVAGDADVLIAPNIHAGNIMGKMLLCTCNAKMAGFIAGASCPIVLTSRGSSPEEKFLSIVLSSSATAENA